MLVLPSQLQVNLVLEEYNADVTEGTVKNGSLIRRMVHLGTGAISIHIPKLPLRRKEEGKYWHQ
jgi:hypothetical protein